MALRHATLALMAMLLSMAAVCTEIPRAAAAQAVERGSESDNPDGKPPGNEPRPGQPRQEQVATAAVVLLAGILLIGVVLMTWVVLWGGRLRRLARRPLPESAGIDEMWYLKPKHKMPQSSSDEQQRTGDSPGSSIEPP